MQCRAANKATARTVTPWLLRKHGNLDHLATTAVSADYYNSEKLKQTQIVFLLTLAKDLSYLSFICEVLSLFKNLIDLDVFPIKQLRVVNQIFGRTVIELIE